MGDHVLRQMREFEVLQAVMRFRRDKRGATVYVHTSALPDWVPRKHGEVVRKRHAGERNVITALHDLGNGTTGEIASEANCSAQLASNHLGRLEDEGHVTRRKDGLNTVWSIVTPTNLNENFAVNLGKPQ
jgi:predicted transcriptional regulator